MCVEGEGMSVGVCGGDECVGVCVEGRGWAECVGVWRGGEGMSVGVCGREGMWVWRGGDECVCGGGVLYC